MGEYWAVQSTAFKKKINEWTAVINPLKLGLSPGRLIERIFKKKKIVQNCRWDGRCWHEWTARIAPLKVQWILGRPIERKRKSDVRCDPNRPPKSRRRSGTSDLDDKILKKYKIANAKTPLDFTLLQKCLISFYKKTPTVAHVSQ